MRVPMSALVGRNRAFYLVTRVDRSLQLTFSEPRFEHVTFRLRSQVRYTNCTSTSFLSCYDYLMIIAPM